MFLFDAIRHAASRDPNRTALIVDNKRYCYGELERAVLMLANEIAAKTSVGDRVMILSENSFEAVVFLYAIPHAGRIATFGNTRLHPNELLGIVSDVEPTLVVISDRELQRIEAFEHETGTNIFGANRIVRTTSEFLGSTSDTGNDVDGLVNEQTSHGTRSPTDIAWIIHTSGTTGLPKGACLTHSNIIAAVLNTALVRPLRADDVYLYPFPLFHVAAYNVVHAHLQHATVVLEPKFDAVAVARSIGRHRVTSISLAPTMIAMLLDELAGESNYDISSLKVVQYGASAIPRDVLLRGLDVLDCGFAQGYGMTELSGNASVLTPAHHVAGLGAQPELLGAAGVAGPLVEIRIVNEHGDVCPDGTPGEIVVRGDQVITQYWNRPDLQRQMFVELPNGDFFRTGDIGVLENSMLVVVDRAKDIIVSGGENISSLEVENVLCQHPSIDAVAVIGTPHETWGEQVTAVIVPRGIGAIGDDAFDSEVVEEFVRSRLSGFKVPKRYETISAMPLNASGKVVKATLRSRFG